MTERNPYKQIIDHYGEKHQIHKLNEEQYELCEALYDRYLHQQDYENSEEWRNKMIELNRHVEEEIADNLVLIRQFIATYQLNNMRIEDFVRQKVDRQLERMNKGE